MRTVTVFATKGKRKAKIETDARVWSELKELVSNEGYDMSSLHATENINRTDLAHEDARLPEGNFTLFLRPKKTKSGVDYSKMGFKELRAELSDDDKVQITNQTGKNWTRCSTEDLKDYLSSKGTPVSETSEVAEASENAIDAGDNNTSRINAVKVILKEIGENNDSDEVSERLEIVNDEIEGLVSAIQDEESSEASAEKAAEEARIKAEKEEEERLAQEANDMMKGF